MQTKITNKKINILGAGISGLVSGIVLAKNGYQVEIFEKRSRVGSFFEKDIHSLRNYSYDYDVIEKYKELGIEISNIYPVFKELRFSSSSKHIEVYSENKPLFYNFIRGCSDERSLDNELFEQAKSHGIKFHFNQAVNRDDKDIDIVAVGASSVKGVAYGRHYIKDSTAKIDSIYYLMGDSHAPHGYIYMAPFFNEFSLVIAGTKIESKKELEERFNLLIKDNNIIKNFLNGAKFKNEIYGFIHFNPPKTAKKDKKIYVGEAAGFVDAATGFGTHYAILSGCLAARAIMNNEDYGNLWKKSFGKELKKKYLKRLRLEKLNSENYEMMVESLLKIFGKRVSVENYKKYKFILVVMEMIKKALNSIRNEFVYGGHLLSLGASSIVFTSAILLGIKITWDCLFIVYLGMQSAYLYNRYKDFKKDYLTNPERTKHFEKYVSKIPIIIGIFILIIILMLYYFSTPKILFFGLSLLLMSLLYSKIFKNLTKKIVGFKGFYVSLMWASLSLFLIFYYYLSFSLSLFFILVFIFLRWTINTSFCDIKDIESDKKEKLLTLAVVLRKEKLIKFLNILNILSFLPIILGVFFNLFPFYSIILVFTVFYAFYYFKQVNNLVISQNFLYNVIVDGEFILWSFFILLGKILI
ncbi:MAG: UbiA family prenyltransferase [Candidatus Nealsonbacteria bacterium]|nr:UbiA family prenyltransferase [Candidatus Nealsonbacteria bacterium]